MTEEQSYLYEKFTSNQIEKATTGNGIFYYNHNFAVTLDTFNNNDKLKNFWKLTSWSETPSN